MQVTCGNMAVELWQFDLPERRYECGSSRDPGVRKPPGGSKPRIQGERFFVLFRS